jgi:hypothetical protein
MLTLFVICGIFWVMVYPKLSYIEGAMSPVFEYEDHYYFSAGEVEYLGASLISQRTCLLREMTMYNDSATAKAVLYDRKAYGEGVQYSVGTKVSTAPFVFNPQYLGHKLEKIYIVVKSSCHPLWLTATKVEIPIK